MCTLPSTPFLRIPSANDTCVEAGPGMHWQRAKISRKTFTVIQCSFSIRYCTKHTKKVHYSVPRHKWSSLAAMKRLLNIPLSLYTTHTRGVANSTWQPTHNLRLSLLVFLSQWWPSQVGHPLIWRSSFEGDQIKIGIIGPKLRGDKKKRHNTDFPVGRHFRAGKQALLCECGITCVQCNYHISMCIQIGITMSLHYQNLVKLFRTWFG